MKVLAVAFFFLAAVASSGSSAENCLPTNCKPPSCRCASAQPPIAGTIPQLVSLSFDDAVIKSNFDNFIRPVLYPRKNPDNCPIRVTMFVPHEYTDYSVVNNMYNHGFEIGSHSVTKNYSSEYWQNATTSLIEAEMGGQRKILAHFANISIDSIVSSRIPSFQLNGDETYKGLQKAGFLLDSSWPTHSSNGTSIFPYSLDFDNKQPCFIGTCPHASIKGFWITPITNWKSQDSVDCNKLLACNVHGSATEIFEWMKKNFLTFYNGNRAPFTVLVNDALFGYYKNSKEALIKFLDYLGTLKDVFLVSEKQVVDWMKNPVEAKKYSSCVKAPPVAGCHQQSCKLNTVTNETRYMVSCVACPDHYPWLGDTFGDKTRPSY